MKSIIQFNFLPDDASDEAYQEAYENYLKLEDYCQTYGLGFYFEETKNFLHHIKY